MRSSSLSAAVLLPFTFCREFEIEFCLLRLFAFILYFLVVVAVASSKVFFFSCFFFFLPLPCFSLILHPRRDAKWAITARFDCGPDVLNGSDVRIAIAIRHSPLALPNPKVHAKQQQQQPLKLPFPHSLQYGVPSPHTHSTVRSIVNHLKENREREKPPNAHRCEIALGQQRVFVRIRVHIPLPFRVFGSVRFGGFFSACFISVCTPLSVGREQGLKFGVNGEGS